MSTELLVALAIAGAVAVVATTVGAAYRESHKDDAKKAEEEKAANLAKEAAAKYENEHPWEFMNFSFQIRKGEPVEVSLFDFANNKGQAYRDLYTGVTVTCLEDIRDYVIPAMKAKEEAFLRAQLAEQGINVIADIDLKAAMSGKTRQRRERVEGGTQDVDLKPLSGSKCLLEGRNRVHNLYDSRKGLRQEAWAESHCQVRAYRVMRKQARAYKRNNKWGADEASC